MTNDQANYYSVITSFTVNEKNVYELKGKFLDDLHKNAFSGTNGEDVIEHIEYFLKIVDPIDSPNVNQDKLRVVVFPISLVGDAWRWFDEIKGSITRSDEIEPTNDETSDLEETDYDDEQILRIETNMFNYETPLCEKFKKFNYLLKIGPDVLTNDIKGFKTYEEYKDDWIYEWNENVAWDYEWYEALEDKELKEEALRNKAIVEGTIDDDEEQEICSNKTHKLSVCNIRRLEMIKYLFRDDEEYVTIKEDEYETSTSKDACQAYQEIFRMVDEGWMDLVESKEIDEVDEVSII
uniref:Uncharacterized protein n=1 Tax=Tanacetum cinerariifolium TaxID=118510 RepID=A0A699KA98_TANCI|nr:hypothetical protein [Tanacetum cinerariifolium]